VVELKGAFRVEYRAPDSEGYLPLRDDLLRGGFLEEMAVLLNGWIALPEDVALAFAECGEPNAFYEPEQRAVILCYELVEDLDRAYAGHPDGAQAVDDALVFTTLHEVGHALVDVLDLPITGREEDAVDQLAALILADGTEEGDLAAINGVAALGEEEVIDDLAFADEHALGAQRFYNVACLVYGQDPEKYAAWVRDGVLPAERAARCPGEYANVSEAWSRLLYDYLKE
jgi:hypothetical protein